MRCYLLLRRHQESQTPRTRLDQPQQHTMQRFQAAALLLVLAGKRGLV